MSIDWDALSCSGSEFHSLGVIKHKPLSKPGLFWACAGGKYCLIRGSGMSSELRKVHGKSYNVSMASNESTLHTL